VVLLALVMSLVAVTRDDAGLDEAYVYALGQHGFGALLRHLADDASGLLALITSYPFTATGDALWWIRLPSVLMFCGSVLALWWTARAIVSDRVALAGAALLAVNPLALSYADDARWPALALLLGVLSWGFLLRGATGGGTGTWTGYALALAAAAYANPFSLVLVLPQAVAVLILRRDALRRFALAVVGAAALCIPLALLVRSADAVNPLFRNKTPGLGDVPGFLGEVVAGGAPERLRQLTVLAGVVLVAAAAWRLRDRLASPLARAGLISLAWLAIPIAAAFVVSQRADGSVWAPRYLIAMAPAACLLLAVAAAALGRRAGLAALAVVAVLLTAGSIEHLAERGGEETRDWAAAIVAARPAGAPVVFYEAEGVQGAGYYEPSLRATDGTPIVPGWDETTVPPGIVLRDNPEFDRLPPGPPDRELVRSLAAQSPSGVVVLAIRPPEPEPDGVTWAREHCTVTVDEFPTERIYRVSACS